MHNCEPEEAVGVVCKTAVSNCQQGHWKCDSSPVCIPTAFICDEVTDCPDGSDENASHCEVSTFIILLERFYRYIKTNKINYYYVLGSF